MSKKFLNVSTTLSSAVVAGGTFTVGYPSGTDEDSFAGYGHKAQAIGNNMTSPGDFTLTFATGEITFTYAASKTTLPAGTFVRIQLNLPAEKARTVSKLVPDAPGLSILTLVRVDLGSPLISDVDGIVVAEATTPAGSMTLTAAAAIPGFSVLGGAPFGRCLTVDSDDGSNTSVLTITGTDWQGNVLIENITVTGTSVVLGKKAFYTVTGITFTNDTDGNVFVGFGDTLGLPFYLGGIDDCPVVFEYEDNILKTNPGTFLGGVDTLATATTGDVRGTYLPITSLPDGSQNFVLFIPSSDPNYHGVTQFTG
jgi:hypothetical protein